MIRRKGKNTKEKKENKKDNKITFYKMKITPKS